jgi:hypothetical protein
MRQQPRGGITAENAEGAEKADVVLSTKLWHARSAEFKASDSVVYVLIIRLKVFR